MNSMQENYNYHDSGQNNYRSTFWINMIVTVLLLILPTLVGWFLLFLGYASEAHFNYNLPFWFPIAVFIAYTYGFIGLIIAAFFSHRSAQQNPHRIWYGLASSIFWTLCSMVVLFFALGLLI